MTTFDKLKLKSRPEYISDIKTGAFPETTITDEEGTIERLYRKYEQKSPYSLLIMVDDQHHELIIEFTGKILLDNYPSLINKDNIGDCLREINRLDVCKLNVEAIIADSEVLKCDVTKDVPLDNIGSIIEPIQQNLRNYKKWGCEPDQRNNGLVIRKLVKSKIRKRRLAIYDKAKEMRKAEYDGFWAAVSNKESMVSYFEGKVRFETNLTSTKAITELLNLPDKDYRLSSVLSSEANPILSVFDEAINSDTVTSKEVSTLKDYLHLLLLQSCNYDMVKVQATLRQYMKNPTRAKGKADELKKLNNQIKPTDATLLQSVRSLLL